MMKLIFLLLMAVPQQGGKVVLNAGITEADFYLDGNFVAVTDEKGTLIMENFPAGSFSYSIVKKGYNSYNGTFSISDGETRLLAPAMEKIREAEEPRGGHMPPRTVPPPADKPKPAGVLQKSVEEAQHSPIEEPTASAPVSGQSRVEASEEELPGMPFRFIGVAMLLIALIALAAAIQKRKRMEQRLPHLEADLNEATSQPPDDAGVRTDPLFLEGLKRREELINAGFAPISNRSANQEAMKEKEVVIVLPKEAFRIEDDQ